MSQIFGMHREAGESRFDIQMLPLNQRLPGILIELKAGKNSSETQLEGLAKFALPPKGRVLVNKRRGLVSEFQN